MKFYCSTCFKATDYTLRKPDSCPHCGTAVAKIIIANPSAKVAINVAPPAPRPTSAVADRLAKARKQRQEEAAQVAEAEDFDEFYEETEEYDPAHRSGKFDHFFATSRDRLGRLGVQVDKDKVEGIKVGDLLKKLQEGQENNQ